jgi:hypothetical protein
MRRGESGGCDIRWCVLWVNGSDYTWQRVNCVYLMWSLSQLTMCLCCMCFCAQSGLLLCAWRRLEMYGTSHKPVHRLTQKADDQSLPHVRLCVCVCVKCIVYVSVPLPAANPIPLLSYTLYVPVALTLCLKGAPSLLSVPIHLPCLIALSGFGLAFEP